MASVPLAYTSVYIGLCNPTRVRLFVHRGLFLWPVPLWLPHSAGCRILRLMGLNVGTLASGLAFPLDRV